MKKVVFFEQIASRVAMIFSDTFPKSFSLCFGQEAVPVFFFCFSYGAEVAISGCFVLVPHWCFAGVEVGASVKSEVGGDDWPIVQYTFP